MPSRLTAALAALASVAALASAAGPARAASPCGDVAVRPWCDPKLSPEHRATLLVTAMTRDEKLDLMSGDGLLGALLATGDERFHVGTLNGIRRLGVPTLHFADGPVGVRQGTGTALPAPLALAAAFDPAAARRTGTLIGREARLKGNHVLHGPAVDVVRTPLFGRAFETYGEDPHLSARLGVQWIKGLQGEGVMANAKHFPVYTQETDRFTVDNLVPLRARREIYLAPFEAAVKEGGVASIMCAYNATNGEPACSSRADVQDVLRGEWGFRGLVVSDYLLATRNTADSVNHGLDLEMPLGLIYAPPILRAHLADGRITQRAVDARVWTTLRTLFAFGVFDRAPYANDGSRIDYDAHAVRSRELAEGSITLLKNDGVLPLKTGGSIAVIGRPAAEYRGGVGSSEVRPARLVTPKDGIAARAGAGTTVTYHDGRDRAGAAAAAKSADVALVFAADKRAEFTDVRCLSLACGDSDLGDQDALISAVAAANPRTVVVLETGGPVLTPWADRVPGVVEAWYPGQQGGAALARVLFGDVDPGGRLPVTFPKAERDAPASGDPRRFPGVDRKATYSEDVFIGYRHYDARGLAPRYPFGFGLSYTTFRYAGLTAGPGGASVTVTNTGGRTGVAVPQLYLGLPGTAAAPQPPRRLEGFAKLTLAPGESRRVTFPLDARAFSSWDEGSKSWRIPPGCHRVMVGSSSRDIAATGGVAHGGARCP